MVWRGSGLNGGEFICINFRGNDGEVVMFNRIHDLYVEKTFIMRFCNRRGEKGIL